MRPTLLIGATGQLGAELVPLLAGAGLVAVTHAELEVADADATAALIARVAPDVIVNTTAFHAVDRCEEEGARAFTVNALAVRHLARSAARAGALLVHFSTDYVFGGAPPVPLRPYREDDPPAPQSAYAVSKLAGECMARAYAPRQLVIRSAGLFGGRGSRGKGGNFVESILRRARAGEPLRVVDDQVTAPTYTAHLARVVVALIERERETPEAVHGIVHATADGACSWHEFASAIVADAGLDAGVGRITTAELGAPAARPAYSILANERLRALALPRPPHWREGLRAYLAATKARDES